MLVEFVSNCRCRQVTLDFGFFFGRLKLEIAQLRKILTGQNFVASHMFLSAFSRRKDFRIKSFDGIIFVLYFGWQKIKFVYAFSGV